MEPSKRSHGPRFAAARCWLSQKGLWFDWPQRQSVARGSVSTVPSSRWTSILLTLDLDLAGHQQRTIAYRRDFGRSLRILVLPAIEPVIEQRAARASPHDLGHVVSAGGVRQNPRSLLELEDARFSAQTF